MAAGDKNDCVIHYSAIGGQLPICGNKRYKYSQNDVVGITCENCLKYLENEYFKIPKLKTMMEYAIEVLEKEIKRSNAQLKS